MKTYKSYNIKDILTLILRSLGKSVIYVDSIRSHMESCPSNPSFASISHALNWIGVENVGVHVSFETLKNDLQKPVLVHLHAEDHIFALVKKIDDQYVYITQYDKDAKVSISEFNKLFTGNVLVYDLEVGTLDIEKGEVISNYLSKVSIGLLPFLFFVSIIFFYRPENSTEIFYSMMYMLGLVISIVLFSKQLGFSNKFTDQVCGGGKSSQVNCDSILTSKAAKFLGIISWSEIGLIYFSTHLFSLFILPYQQILSLVIISSMTSFTYTFYSVYYQWRVAKTWCTLCLAIQVIFLFLFLISIIVIFHGFQLNINCHTVFGLLLIACFCFTLIFSIKSLLEKSNRYQSLFKVYTKLKHIPEVTKSIFSGDLISTKDVEKIILFPGEKNMLTYAFSPICPPCIGKIKILLKFVEKYEDTGIEFIFCNKDITDEKEKNIIFYFIEKSLESADNFVTALKNYVQDYPLSKNQLASYMINDEKRSEVERVWLSHLTWSVRNRIIVLPTLLFNQQKVSEYYTLEDISFMI